MKGHRWFAASFDFMNKITGTERKFLARYRPHIVGEADGRILEIGAGTGASFPYYKNTAKVIATEPDPYMLERARRRLDQLGVDSIELRQAAAEDMPFEDETFDHVVSTMVFCSVSDPLRALSEVRRVLKPGGAFRFIEHVRYDDGLRGRIQDALVPVWSWVGAGCHPNRRTLETLREAGFEVVELDRYKMGMIPVVVGVARSGEARAT